MTCASVRRKLPGYLDGALRSGRDGDTHRKVSRHLEECALCRQELEQYRKLSMAMSRVERAAPPADLAIRIRIAVAEARAEGGWLGRLSRVRNRAHLIIENILEPLALPATCGIVTALVVFAVVMQVFAAGVPFGAVPNDLPTNLVQPARLESLAPFPVGLEELGHGPHLLLVEATVGADGGVVDYQILSGPDTPDLRRQLDQILMFSRFRPLLDFGRPTGGGRVMLSFSEVRVRG